MTPSPGQKRHLPAVWLGLAIAAVFVGAGIVSSHVFERPTSNISRPSAAGQGQRKTAVANPAGLFRVAAIEGQAETFHEEKWYSVQAGDYLSLADVVRTPRGSRALLRRGNTEIELKENVDIRLDKLAERTATFDVLRGGVLASVGAQNETLELSSHDTRTVNQGTARWVVSAGPRGQVSVAASAGEVRFAAQGKEVRVLQGTESTAHPGRAPTEPEKISDSLLLSVIWPSLAPTAEQAEVRGKVRPSSRVKVNGVEADVSQDGSFSASAPLSVGANHVEIEAEDIAGRKKTTARVLERLPQSPRLESSPENLWKR